MNKTNSNQKGFTIIEVVLVLAIAALIFLMVFIALPALQRNQRDSERRTTLGRVSTQITNYQSSNRGKIPQITGSTGTMLGTGGFVAKYTGTGATSSVTGEDFVDPTTGTGYTVTVGTADPSEGQINYQTGKVCGTDGAAATGNGRNFVLRLKLENQTSIYCLDNK